MSPFAGRQRARLIDRRTGACRKLKQARPAQYGHRPPSQEFGSNGTGKPRRMLHSDFTVPDEASSQGLKGLGAHVPTRRLSRVQYEVMRRYDGLGWQPIPWTEARALVHSLNRPRWPRGHYGVIWMPDWALRIRRR